MLKHKNPGQITPNHWVNKNGLILRHRCAMGEANGSFCICAVTCLSTHLVAQPSASVEAGVSQGGFFLLDFRSMTAAAWSVKPQWTRLLRLWKSWQGSTNLKPSSGLPAGPDNCSGQMWGEANSAFFVNNYKWTACACSGNLLKPWRRNRTSAELIGTSLRVVRKAFFPDN